MSSKKKFYTSKYKSRNYNLPSGICVLCGIVSDDDYLGQLLSTPNITVHENCLLFSPLLFQVLSPDVKRDGYIIGFKISDIEREVKRIFRLRCKVCHCSRAGVGCCNTTCRKSFHLTCGLNNGALGIFKDSFHFYCSDHADKQNLTSRLKACEKVVPECTICLSSIADDGYEELCLKDRSGSPWVQFLEKIKERSVIHGECCARCWIHRTCMRQYGLSAGLHHTKCPNCGDKTKFIEVVKQYGIWLPDRDASWELEPGAFRELYDNPVDVTEDATVINNEFEESVNNDIEESGNAEVEESNNNIAEESFHNNVKESFNSFDELVNNIVDELFNTNIKDSVSTYVEELVENIIKEYVNTNVYKSVKNVFEESVESILKTSFENNVEKLVNTNADHKDPIGKSFHLSTIASDGNDCPESSSRNVITKLRKRSVVKPSQSLIKNKSPDKLAKSPPKKIMKRKRKSNTIKEGSLVRKKCSKCSNTIVTLNCKPSMEKNQLSVLKDSNRKQVLSKTKATGKKRMLLSTERDALNLKRRQAYALKRRILSKKEEDYICKSTKEFSIPLTKIILSKCNNDEEEKCSSPKTTESLSLPHKKNVNKTKLPLLRVINSVTTKTKKNNVLSKKIHSKIKKGMRKGCRTSPLPELFLQTKTINKNIMLSKSKKDKNKKNITPKPTDEHSQNKTVKKVLISKTNNEEVRKVITPKSTVQSPFVHIKTANKKSISLKGRKNTLIRKITKKQVLSKKIVSKIKKGNKKVDFKSKRNEQLRETKFINKKEILSKNDKNKKKKDTTSKHNEEHSQIKIDNTKIFSNLKEKKNKEGTSRKGTEQYPTLQTKHNSLNTKNQVLIGKITKKNNKKDIKSKRNHQLPQTETTNKRILTMTKITKKNGVIPTITEQHSLPKTKSTDKKQTTLLIGKSCLITKRKIKTKLTKRMLYKTKMKGKKIDCTSKSCEQLPHIETGNKKGVLSKTERDRNKKETKGKSTPTEKSLLPLTKTVSKKKKPVISQAQRDALNAKRRSLYALSHVVQRKSKYYSESDAQ